MRIFIAILLVLASTAASAAPEAEPSAPVRAPERDISAVVSANGVDPAKSALLIVRMKDRAAWSSGGARIDERFSPASTAKIPHTLIALQTGAAAGANEPYQWDGRRYAFDTWNQNQTLGSAFQNSVVWVYQRIVTELGLNVMGDWLKHFDYGNANVGGPHQLTTYWLDGTLKISAREQVAFLTKLVRYQLPLSPATYASAKRIMRTEQKKGFLYGELVLYQKTGWYSGPEGRNIGWYVGWLDVSGVHPATYVFAFNMEMDNMSFTDPDSDLQKRQGVVIAALKSIGALSP